QVAQIIEARCRGTQIALLLDRGRLCVALDHDEAPQVGAVLTRDLLPSRLTLVLAESDLPVPVPLGEEDPPPVVTHRDVIEMRPALAADVNRCAQVHILRR